MDTNNCHITAFRSISQPGGTIQLALIYRQLVADELRNLFPENTEANTFLFCPLFSQTGSYLPQTYIREEMVVTEEIDNVSDFGIFIYHLCEGKDTFRLQRRDKIHGKCFKSG